jgi:hypothetical protein
MQGIRIGAAAVAAAALAAAGGAAITSHAAGSTAPGVHVAKAGTGLSPSAVGRRGWQADFTYNVGDGFTGVVFTYFCPRGLVPDAGKFDVDQLDPAANSIHLIGEGLSSTQRGAWEWSFNYAGGVSPAGSAITFNVHCSSR